MLTSPTMGTSRILWLFWRVGCTTSASLAVGILQKECGSWIGGNRKLGGDVQETARRLTLSTKRLLMSLLCYLKESTWSADRAIMLLIGIFTAELLVLRMVRGFQTTSRFISFISAPSIQKMPMYFHEIARGH